MSTHFKGSKRESAALETFIKLTRASDIISSNLQLSLKEYGLSEGQFAALDALYHLGPLTQKDLSRKLLRSGGNITMIVDNLEKNGFARRKRGKDDRRFFMVELTPGGRRKIEATFPAQVELITSMLSILSNSEQKELQKICKKLGLGISSKINR
jgi:MarR family 2-MHQ and catechol resistance regulon transcriptional repressor